MPLKHGCTTPVSMCLTLHHMKCCEATTSIGLSLCRFRRVPDGVTDFQIGMESDALRT